jgi:hypothetical protein
MASEFARSRSVKITATDGTVYWQYAQDIRQMRYHDGLLSEYQLVLCQATKTYRKSSGRLFATCLHHRLDGAYRSVLRREGKRLGRESTLPSRTLDLMPWGP